MRAAPSSRARRHAGCTAERSGIGEASVSEDRRHYGEDEQGAHVRACEQSRACEQDAWD